MAECGFPVCERKADVGKLCRGHNTQWVRHGQLWPLGGRRTIDGKPYNRLELLEEDLPILIDRGETVDTAAKHFGYVSRKSLYRVLHRAHRDDLWVRLRANEN